MTIPRSVRSAVGLAQGDRVEVKATDAEIITTTQLVINRSKFPNTDDEYTPAQRRVINRGIALSEKEYKQGRSFGPFETRETFIASAALPEELQRAYPASIAPRQEVRRKPRPLAGPRDRLLAFLLQDFRPRLSARRNYSPPQIDSPGYRYPLHNRLNLGSYAPVLPGRRILTQYLNIAVSKQCK
jgi:bifunctional DNA-binding transcriptional regulator/antitoxin component of YhaV-PrlF toxin-antitoxin module